MVTTHNLFISHARTNPSVYKSLCTVLEQAGFSYKNHSVFKDDPIHNAPNVAALYATIKTQITSCHIVLTMAGKYMTDSKRIKQEIKITRTEFSSPKSILGIKFWANTQVSSIMSRQQIKSQPGMWNQ